VERKNAESARLELELDLNRRNVEHEVVILEAATEDGRKTYSPSLLRDFGRALKSFLITVPFESARPYSRPPMLLPVRWKSPHLPA